MQLYLVRRWGQHSPGVTIEVDDFEQAQWLLRHNYAQRSKDATSVTDNAVAAGTHGPDPRAGGDATRMRPTAIVSVDKRENRAWPVAGSPVQYNAGVRAPRTAENNFATSTSDDSAGRAPRRSRKRAAEK